MVTDFRAFISLDGSKVRMKTENWQHTVPASEAPKWRDFYRRMWARGSKKPDQPGPWAKHHEQPLLAMEEVCRKIKEAAQLP